MIYYISELRIQQRICLAALLDLLQLTIHTSYHASTYTHKPLLTGNFHLISDLAACHVVPLAMMGLQVLKKAAEFSKNDQ